MPTNAADIVSLLERSERDLAKTKGELEKVQKNLKFWRSTHSKIEARKLVFSEIVKRDPPFAERLVELLRQFVKKEESLDRNKHSKTPDDVTRDALLQRLFLMKDLRTLGLQPEEVDAIIGHDLFGNNHLLPEIETTDGRVSFGINETEKKINPEASHWIEKLGSQELFLQQKMEQLQHSREKLQQLYDETVASFVDKSSQLPLSETSSKGNLTADERIGDKSTNELERPLKSNQRRKRSRLELETIVPKIVEEARSLYDEGNRTGKQVFEELASRSLELFGEVLTPGQMKGLFDRSGERLTK